MQADTGSGGAQERVADLLRAQITEGHLLPGASLSETALAAEFGVSRTPVREALKRLETEGVVEIRPRVGTFVTSPSRLEINELFEVKEILEGAAARLFAARGNIPELERLRENVRQSTAAIQDGDVERYEALVHEFHGLIIQGAGNRKLEQHYRMLMNQLRYGPLVHISLRSSGRAGQSDHEHHTVLAMIEARDMATSERVMRDHVRASQQALMDALDVNPDGATLPGHGHPPLPTP